MWKLIVGVLIAHTHAVPLQTETSTQNPKDANVIFKLTPGFSSYRTSSGAICSCTLTYPNASSRDDYQYSPEVGRHKVHKRKLNWNDARRVCMDEGGHLAIINTKAEALVLSDMMKTNNFDEAFVGIHDYFEDGQWTTVLGDPLERAGYSKWTENEPNNDKNNEQCGGLMRSGGLNDMNCSDRHFFICEIPIGVIRF